MVLISDHHTFLGKGIPMKQVIYIQFRCDGSRSDLLAQLVECYRNVFADGPWHEWLKCQCCEKYWGIKDKAELAGQGYQHCGEPVVDFWPRNKVVQDLRQELSENSVCWLAVYDEKVVGFSWAYQIQVHQLEAKLGITFEDVSCEQTVMYLDDVGVLSEFRDQKIAKEMVRRTKETFLRQNVQICVARTRQSPEPSKLFLWHTEKLGYNVIAHYARGDGRVVLARQLDQKLLGLLA